MALRKIKKDDDPVLRKISKEVKEIDDRILTLLDDMEETMKHSEGVGLAAPQVGVLKRVIVINTDGETIKLINPQIVEQEGRQCGEEACLSVSDKSGMVSRPKRVKVKYLNIKGEEQYIESEDLKARCLCHEIDHLNGILYTDIAEKIYKIVKKGEKTV